MSRGELTITQAVIVETELEFTIIELSRICGTDVATIEALVQEHVLKPREDHSGRCVFAGAVLPRARRATRLVRELELNAAGAALVLDLCDEIDSLRARLRRLGG